MTSICCPNCGGSGGGSGWLRCGWCYGTGDYDARDRRGRHLTYEASYKQANRSYFQIRIQPQRLIAAWKALAAWFAREVPLWNID